MATETHQAWVTANDPEIPSDEATATSPTTSP
jgi:hypothetical protein